MGIDNELSMYEYIEHLNAARMEYLSRYYDVCSQIDELEKKMDQLIEAKRGVERELQRIDSELGVVSKIDTSNEQG